MGKRLRAMPAEYPLVRQELLARREENAEYILCADGSKLGLRAHWPFGRIWVWRSPRRLHMCGWMVDGGEGRGERAAGGVRGSALGEKGVCNRSLVPQARLGQHDVWWSLSGLGAESASMARIAQQKRRAGHVASAERAEGVPPLRLRADRDAAKFGSAGVMMAHRSLAMQQRQGEEAKRAGRDDAGQREKSTHLPPAAPLASNCALGAACTGAYACVRQCAGVSAEAAKSKAHKATETVLVGQRSDDGRLAPSATNLLTRRRPAPEQDTTCGSWHMLKTGLSPQHAGLGPFCCHSRRLFCLRSSEQRVRRGWPSARGHVGSCRTAKFCSLQQAAKGAHGTPCDMQFPPHLPPASTAGQGVVEPRLTGEAQMPAQPCHAQLLIALPCLPHSPPGRLGRLHARPANHPGPSRPRTGFQEAPRSERVYATTVLLPCRLTEACKPAGQVEAMALGSVQAKLHDGTLVPTVGSCASRPSHCGT
ncbi:hypothetical protein COCC4DRAFT_66770 [Bipolaris maydis ATCC 48331]|uniref:Uncharacterized protein n=1 Tax=Cochliobolus heterostrophus (strain C4 / ATCC 48331 / race T) TaxID=665024 RepID=N4WXQ3_COCH4|nr:uncharacterized protein COCC4DRAFT_66770 [Bipolaris maydis ATCC 48331]ENH99130.1 hypothetical protein COCC4DRAFT_66770 [Bipolaris maydis ATCC 48331]